MLFLIIGAVIVLLLVLLRIADRHDARKGHRPRRMGDIRSATQQSRRDLRTARTQRYLPRALPVDPNRRPPRAKQQND